MPDKLKRAGRTFACILFFFVAWLLNLLILGFIGILIFNGEDGIRDMLSYIFVFLLPIVIASVETIILRKHLVRKRAIKNSASIQTASPIPKEEACVAVDCSSLKSHEPCSHEKAPQDFIQQPITKAEKGNAQGKILEPAINTDYDAAQPEPVLQDQPAPGVQSAAEGSKNKTAEHSINQDSPDSIPALGNADIDTEEAPSNGQKPDKFDCIRDPKLMAHYIVLDLETTGFSRDNDRIIEIAAIHYVFGEEAKRFHTYINPQMQIPKHITRLTGISQTDVDAAPLLDDIADDFREFIKDYPLVGHNIINFDLPFLESHISFDAPHFVIDTLDMSRFAFPLLPSHKLSDLNFWFNLNNGDPHRADADAAATNALMWACLYPDKYASLYRKAIRDDRPKTEHIHKSRPYHRSDRVNTAEIKPNPDRNEEFKPLLGKRIVFTGELSIPRKDAMQMAVDAGASLRSNVSSKTDILVAGRQDLSVVGADGMSSKQEKAQEINASGKGNIKIVDEAEFISMISSVPDSDTN